MTDRPDRTRSSRTVLVLVGAALILLGVIAIAGLLSGSVREQSTAQFQEVTVLELDLDSAAVTVRADGESVVVRKDVTSGWFGGSSSEEQNGSTLRVVKRCPPVLGFGCGGTYVITVPAGVEVRGGTSNGAITLDGIEAAVDVATSNGAIEMSGLSGEVSVRTSNGRIQGGSLSSPSLRASTSNGRINLELSATPTTLEARTSNGDIEIVLADDAPAVALSTTTSNGRTDTQIRTDPNADASMTITTSNGDITVRYPS
ncbi:MAG TPA: DUF4097 family beta strand repeat-containing protein [Acidimicrobiia bacterium]|jgi:hypothetical protein